MKAQGRDYYWPVINEHSNGVLYSVSYTRKNTDNTVLEDDQVLPFVQIRQTVIKIGDDKLKLETLILNAESDAYKMALQTHMAVVDTPWVDCTRMIQGVERTGKSLDATLIQSNPETGKPAIGGRIEVYGFTDDNGKGIAIMLKVRTEDDTQSRMDEVLAESLLDSLVVIPIDQYTPYIYELAGYPISMPVGSSLSNLSQESEHVISGDIGMYELNGQFQLVMVPENYSVSDTAKDIEKRFYASMAEQETLGNLTTIWNSQSMFPVGTGAAAQNIFPVNIFKIKDGSYLYNQQHVMVDGQYIITVTLNSPASGTKNLHNYAKAFYAKSKADFSWKTPQFSTQYAPGFELKLPSGYRNWRTNRDGLLHSMLISPFYSADSEELLDNAIEHKPYTQITFFRADAGMNLESAHRAVCQQVRDQHQDREQFPDDEPFDEEAMERSIDLPDGTKMDAIWNYFMPKDNNHNDVELGLQYENINVTSVMIPVDDGHTMAVVSSISNELMHVDALATTAHIIDWLEPTQTVGDVELSFGTLTYNPWIVKAYSSSDTFDKSHSTRMTVGSDLIIIKTMQIEQDDLSRSTQNLAKIFLKSAFRRSAYENEYGLYPSDSSKLEKISIAGHKGKMIEEMLTIPKEATTWQRRADSNLRVYGFRHGDQYTTITMSQESDFDSDRFDIYAGMFVPGD